MKNIKRELPELTCISKPHKGCNDGYYIVRIPISFMPIGGRYIGLYHEYRFIGLKGLNRELVNKEKGR